MQRTVAIDNVRRSAALTRRLTRRQSAPPGVINWREFASRRTSAAFGTRRSTSPLVASGARFAVSRPTPSSDGLELFAATPHRESHAEGAPRPRVRSDAAVDYAERPSAAAAPAPSNVPAPQYRISRRSAAGADATRAAQRPTAPTAPAARAQDVTPAARPARTNTAGDLVLRRSPSKTPEPADATARRDAAPNVPGRPGPHTPAATAPRSQGNVASPGASQSETLSRKAANTQAARPAPARSAIGRAQGRVSIARKHQPKGSAFPPRDTPLRRKTRPGGRAGVTTHSGETPRPVLNVARAKPDGNAAAPAASTSDGGAYGAAGDFVAAPPPTVEARASSNVIGAGLQHHSPTIMRSALPAAPVRRVEVRPRAEETSARETLSRKVAPAPSAEPAEARPLVMRRAASTASLTHAAPHAAAETPASSPAPDAAAQPPEIDLAQLAEQVSRIITRRLAVERERRGQWK